MLFDTAYWSLEDRDKEGEERGNNKGVGRVSTIVAAAIATATNALNSLKQLNFAFSLFLTLYHISFNRSIQS